MNRSVPFVAAAAALLAGVSLTSCTAKEATTTTGTGDNAAGAPAEVTVNATDTGCELSATEGTTGANTFVITNNGNKVTEFYVYGEGERVMGEVENISPGLHRKLIVQLTEPGTYQTACKPGMIGDGIRGDFKVTGEAVQIDTEGKFKEAADNYKRYVNSQTDALIPATQVFVDAVKRGDIAAAKAQFPIARTYYERIEPVAESFPDDLDPRIDLREADLEPGQKWTGFHRLEKDLWVHRPAAGHQRDRRPVGGRRQGTRRRREGARLHHRLHPDRRWRTGTARRGRRPARSAAKRTSSATPTCGTSTPTCEGSQTAVASVRPILDERNPDLGKRVDQRFTEVEALLAEVPPGRRIRALRQGDRAAAPGAVARHRRAEQGSKPGARCHRPTVSRSRSNDPVDARPPVSPTVRVLAPQAPRRGGGGRRRCRVPRVPVRWPAGRPRPAIRTSICRQPVPFRGERQAGIITEAQDRMHFATFDVTTDCRADVVAC